jgi:hypothetical protein
MMDGLTVKRGLGPKGYRWYVLLGKRVMGSAMSRRTAIQIRNQVAANRIASGVGE